MFTEFICSGKKIIQIEGKVLVVHPGKTSKVRATTIVVLEPQQKSVLDVLEAVNLSTRTLRFVDGIKRGDVIEVKRKSVAGEKEEVFTEYSRKSMPIPNRLPVRVWVAAVGEHEFRTFPGKDVGQVQW
jgi:ABC-type sulfate/molybdate transport systems ATPase subunit